MSTPCALLATNVAFAVVFGAFVVALVILAFITLRWAVRRDRIGRRAWLARRSGDLGRGVARGEAPVPEPSSNGHKPVTGRRSRGPGGE